MVQHSVVSGQTRCLTVLSHWGSDIAKSAPTLLVAPAVKGRYHNVELLEERWHASRSLVLGDDNAVTTRCLEVLRLCHVHGKVGTKCHWRLTMTRLQQWGHSLELGNHFPTRLLA